MPARKTNKVTDADLALVGPDTPAGQWLRRYWLAVCRCEDLKDIPLGIKVLGEDLVLFRDDHGRPGLLGMYCAHRGSSRNLRVYKYKCLQRKGDHHG